MATITQPPFRQKPPKFIETYPSYTNSETLSYPKTEIFSATQLMLTSSDPSQFSKAGLLLTANLFSGASRLRNYRPKQEPAPFLNTLLPGIAALTYHAKRKRPPKPPHVCPFSLVLLASFTHSTKLPIFHPAPVLRHTPTLNNHLDIARGAFPTSSQTTPGELPHSRDLDTACANSTISKL
jgi:hypothetical protein